MNQKLYDLIEANLVIAAVKDMESLDTYCQRDETKVVFILFEDIYNTSAIVEQTKASDKVATVYIGLVTGLSSKEVAVDFIRNNTSADEIILTKLALIKWARELSLYTTLRVFVLDSMVLENIEKQMSVVRPDIIKILPGLMSKVICRVCRLVKVLVIAGGFISDKEDVMVALSAGATSVSITNQKVWLMRNQKLKPTPLGKENEFMYK